MSTLPEKLTKEADFVALYEYEQGGDIKGLTDYLVSQEEQELVAKYLIFLGSPTLCKAMQLTLVGNETWDFPFKAKDTTIANLDSVDADVQNVFFLDTPGENNFEGTEHNQSYKVNKYDYIVNPDVSIESETVSTIIILKLIQKIMDYSLEEVPRDLQLAKMTKYQDCNLVRDQLMAWEEREGIYFYKELRNEIGQKVYNLLKSAT